MRKYPLPQNAMPLHLNLAVIKHALQESNGSLLSSISNAELNDIRIKFEKKRVAVSPDKKGCIRWLVALLNNIPIKNGGYPDANHGPLSQFFAFKIPGGIDPENLLIGVASSFYSLLPIMACVKFALISKRGLRLLLENYAISKEALSYLRDRVSYSKQHFDLVRVNAKPLKVDDLVTTLTSPEFRKENLNDLVSKYFLCVMSNPVRFCQLFEGGEKLQQYFTSNKQFRLMVVYAYARGAELRNEGNIIFARLPNHYLGVANFTFDHLIVLLNELPSQLRYLMCSDSLDCFNEVQLLVLQKFERNPQNHLRVTNNVIYIEMKRRQVVRNDEELPLSDALVTFLRQLLTVKIEDELKEMLVGACTQLLDARPSVPRQQKVALLLMQIFLLDSKECAVKSLVDEISSFACQDINSFISFAFCQFQLDINPKRKILDKLAEGHASAGSVKIQLFPTVADIPNFSGLSAGLEMGSKSALSAVQACIFPNRFSEEQIQALAEVLQEHFKVRSSLLPSSRKAANTSYGTFKITC
jgi:hypothetical protein